MKFQFAPGLPGYGTKGVDGSTGLSGLATYFSAYDGNSDSITIKTKIGANKILFSTDEYLPGYPIRVYQTGDIFIDKNARIFEIDLVQPNLYVDTGVFLNTSGFFTSLKLSPIYNFERLSNSYVTDKYLIDSVYSNTVGDYTTYPLSIYSNKPADYARVNYDDLTANSFYPFQIWTTGKFTNDDAIALVREATNNIWRFGNKNAGSQRTVSLALDYTDVSIYGNILMGGNITAGGNILGGGTQLQMGVGGTYFLVSPTQTVVNEGSGDMDFRVESDSYSHMFFVDAGANRIGINRLVPSTTLDVNGNIQIYTTTSNRAFYLPKNTVAGNAGSLSIYTGGGFDEDEETPVAYRGGQLYLYTGDSGNKATDGAGIDGPLIRISGGRGGDASCYSVAYAGGAGALVRFVGGRGGNSLGNAGTGLNRGGDGGDVELCGGIKGLGTDLNGTDGIVRLGYEDGSTRGTIISHAAHTFLSNINLVTSARGFSSPAADQIDITLSNDKRFDLRYDGDYSIIESDHHIKVEPKISTTHGKDVFIIAGESANSSGYIGGNVYIRGGNGYNTDGSIYLGDINTNVVYCGTHFLPITIGTKDLGSAALYWDEVYYVTLKPQSDLRIKKNIQKLETISEKLNALNPISFEWKENDNPNKFKKEYGLIAQEVEKVIPELVIQQEGAKYKDQRFLNYQGLTAWLIKGFQEQQKKIEALEEEIKKLKKSNH